MKKIIFNSLLVFVAAALGLTVGFALRGKPVSQDTAETSPATAASSGGSRTKTSRASKQRVHVRLNDDSPLATKLERDLSMSSGVTRWLYWLDAIEHASALDFPRLFRLAEGNAAARRLVSQRWIELYPRHLFDTIVDAAKNGRALSKGIIDLSYSLFTEWSKRDPEAVIAALSEPNDFSMRSARHTVAGAVIEKDAERGLRLFSEWHIENYSPRMNGVAKWAAADPRHAAEFALANPAGYASQMTMETIGKEWAKTDPARALEFATSKPGEFSSTLAAAALKEWAGRNLNEAADWLAATDTRTRNRLGTSFVEAWAKQDMNSALTWCESNLTGSSLAQAVGGVMKGAAEKDVPAAAAVVASLNPSAARAEAAVAVAKKWFPQLSAGKPVPSEALTWLAGLDGDSTQRVLGEIQWGWATSDPKSMAAFLASSNERFPANAYNILAREMARKNPTEALEWASRLSEDRSLSAGADAFSEWRRSQPDAAMKWLNELSSSDLRRVPYFQNAVRSIVWDVQGAEQLAAMSASERAAAQTVIETMSLPDDRRTRLLDILKVR